MEREDREKEIALLLATQQVISREQEKKAEEKDKLKQEAAGKAGMSLDYIQKISRKRTYAHQYGTIPARLRKMYEVERQGRMAKNKVILEEQYKIAVTPETPIKTATRSKSSKQQASTWLTSRHLSTIPIPAGIGINSFLNMTDIVHLGSLIPGCPTDNASHVIAEATKYIKALHQELNFLQNQVSSNIGLKLAPIRTLEKKPDPADRALKTQMRLCHLALQLNNY